MMNNDKNDDDDDDVPFSPEHQEDEEADGIRDDAPLNSGSRSRNDDVDVDADMSDEDLFSPSETSLSNDATQFVLDAYVDYVASCEVVNRGQVQKQNGTTISASFFGSTSLNREKESCPRVTSIAKLEARRRQDLQAADSQDAVFPLMDLPSDVLLNIAGVPQPPLANPVRMITLEKWSDIATICYPLILTAKHFFHLLRKYTNNRMLAEGAFFVVPIFERLLPQLEEFISDHFRPNRNELNSLKPAARFPLLTASWRHLFSLPICSELFRMRHLALTAFAELYSLKYDDTEIFNFLRYELKELQTDTKDDVEYYYNYQSDGSDIDAMENNSDEDYVDEETGNDRTSFEEAWTIANLKRKTAFSGKFRRYRHRKLYYHKNSKHQVLATRNDDEYHQCLKALEQIDRAHCSRCKADYPVASDELFVESRCDCCPCLSPFRLWNKPDNIEYPVAPQFVRFLASLQIWFHSRQSSARKNN
jgi:hypothetical protein